MIKSIDTLYNGNYFRSRLEARWAVFLDYCEIRYQYEPEGFVLDDNCYLPDFYLPEANAYVEVKPEWNEATDKNIVSTLDKALDFIFQKKSNFILFIGMPCHKNIRSLSSYFIKKSIEDFNIDLNSFKIICKVVLLNAHQSSLHGALTLDFETEKHFTRGLEIACKKRFEFGEKEDISKISNNPAEDDITPFWIKH